MNPPRLWFLDDEGDLEARLVRLDEHLHDLVSQLDDELGELLESGRFATKFQSGAFDWLVNAGPSPEHGIEVGCESYMWRHAAHSLLHREPLSASLSASPRSRCMSSH